MRQHDHNKDRYQEEDIEWTQQADGRHALVSEENRDGDKCPYNEKQRDAPPFHIPQAPVGIQPKQTIYQHQEGI